MVLDADKILLFLAVITSLVTLMMVIRRYKPDKESSEREIKIFQKLDTFSELVTKIEKNIEKSKK